MELTRQEISRQIDIIPPSILDKSILVIGAGAIGSWTILALAKMGFSKISVIDHDEVDIVNMASQFYGVKDVGSPKVAALAGRIQEMVGLKLTHVIPEKWPVKGFETESFDIVIPAVDSMDIRTQVFNMLKDKAPACQAIIDARMGAETALLYAINPMSGEDQKVYKNTLYTDEEAVQAPCTAKSTTYCALVLSGLVAQTVRDVLMRKKYMRSLQLTLKDHAWEAGVKQLTS